MLIPGRTLASNGVELIDEDDGGSTLASSGEELANATSADSDVPAIPRGSAPVVGRSEKNVHLVKFGSRSREEVNTSLSGNSTREEGFSSSRRAGQKDSARDLAAELRKALRVLQELDNLVQLGLGLFAAVDILEAGTAARGVVGVWSGGRREGGRLRRAGSQDSARVEEEGEEGQSARWMGISLSSTTSFRLFNSQQERVEGRDKEEANSSEGDGALGLLHYDPDGLGTGRSGCCRTEGRSPGAEASLRDDLGLSSLSSTGGTREESRDEGGRGEGRLGGRWWCSRSDGGRSGNVGSRSRGCRGRSNVGGRGRLRRGRNGERSLEESCTFSRRLVDANKVGRRVLVRSRLCSERSEVELEELLVLKHLARRFGLAAFEP